jgi:hypothetical protein
MHRFARHANRLRLANKTPQPRTRLSQDSDAPTRRHDAKLYHSLIFARIPFSGCHRIMTTHRPENVAFGLLGLFHVTNTYGVTCLCSTTSIANHDNLMESTEVRSAFCFGNRKRELRSHRTRNHLLGLLQDFPQLFSQKLRRDGGLLKVGMSRGVPRVLFELIGG